MKPKNHIWVFIGKGGRFPSAAYTAIEDAEEWIRKNKLTGMLSAMPIDQSVFDWALESDALNLKPEKLEEKKNDPGFIGAFNTGSLEHYHYENGVRE